MNPLKETLITDYIYKDLPYGGTVTRTLMKELYEEYKRVTGISSTSEKLPENPEEETV
ncbi:hypothetical protein [Cohnella kolymensis]|uniref:hypothetical protein n=1 Tax=Cohnella kolymensis TaxID=1590652 RepID=UPI0013791FB8|nr:hypothetical protein [Cohnella kolymensis]